MFEIIKKNKKNSRRSGLLKTQNGVIKTPFFMPIATKGAVKSLAPEDLKDLGAQMVLGNTYHLWLRPGTEIIKCAGDLHKFMNWPGPILTDSGGYQVFSLGEKMSSANSSQNRRFFPSEKKSTRQNCSLVPASSRDTVPVRNFERFEELLASPGPKTSFVKISDAGVEFRDPIDGKKYWLTPEKSIEIQLALGSDIIMVLDECPPYPASREQVAKAVARTTEWARKCKAYFERKVKNIPKEKRPLIFCIVQGGIYEDLRLKSAKELIEIGFSDQGGPASGWDGYAVGGVAVGEPRKYLATVLEAVMPLLPEDKPRYLMGLGKPEEIVSAVNSGVDMFDCVIPTREARHGRLYKFKNQNSKIKIASQKSKFYEIIQITNSRFSKNFKPIDEACDCYTCQNYSRAYLHHLFNVGEPLSLRLATIHNLKFYLGLMEGLRK